MPKVTIRDGSASTKRHRLLDGRLKDGSGGPITWSAGQTSIVASGSFPDSRYQQRRQADAGRGVTLARLADDRVRRQVGELLGDRADEPSFVTTIRRSGGATSPKRAAVWCDHRLVADEREQLLGRRPAAGGPETECRTRRP